MAVVIDSVQPRSKAWWHGIKAGDKLLKINQNSINDVLDYRFYITDERLTLLFETKGGKQRTVKIRNKQGGEIGLTFATYLMDKQRSCANNCIFCFMDQLPPNVRKTMLFKDDDVRLSFLQGNYVTLTNLTDDDINRLCKLRVSPINVSVHVTDGQKRTEMLKNPNAANVLSVMRRFADAGISMNAQIVLCKGVNDGKYLEKSINDLYSLYPSVKSVSVVPVGLSKYRDSLCSLEGFDGVSSLDVIKLIEPFQNKFKNEVGTSLVYLADEFYINAGVPIPLYEHYEDFPQIENGVGLIAAMRDEIDSEIDYIENTAHSIKPKTIVTSYIAYDFICECVSKIKAKVPSLNVEVVKIKNDFFGEKITVTGLLCGSDIIKQLKDKHHYDTVMLSESMFKDDEDIFLDDTYLCDVESALNVKVIKTPNTGYGFIKAILE